MPSATTKKSPFANPPPRGAGSGVAGGIAFTPKEDAETKGVTPPTMPGTPAFYFKSHPKRWQVLHGEIVPILGRLQLRPGVAGVQEGRDGGVSLRAARAAQEERNWTLIPFDAIPASHGTSYLQRLEARPDVVLSIYERAYPGSSETTADEPMYLEFLKHLVSAKVIPPVETHVLESMLSDRERQLARAMDLAASNPSKQSDVDRLKVEVTALEAELKTRQRHVIPSKGEAFKPEASD